MLKNEGLSLERGEKEKRDSEKVKQLLNQISKPIFPFLESDTSKESLLLVLFELKNLSLKLKEYNEYVKNIYFSKK